MIDLIQKENKERMRNNEKLQRNEVIIKWIKK